MSIVRIDSINDNNFKEVISLDVNAQQKSFIVSNMFSLAEAYVNKDLIPKAIMVEDLVVGFMMYTYNDDNYPNMCTLTRFMIDKKNQNHGYGKEALTMLKELALSKKVEGIAVRYVSNNEIAARLYASIGMKETGKIIGDESEAILRF